MLVVLYPASWIQTSQQAKEHPPKVRPCLCSLLHKQNARGRDGEKDSASHKPPIKLPVSKHSPTPSSFHAIYSIHTRNTNWTKPCQSHFLSKGLCKQNQLAVMVCVVLTACKAFSPSAAMTVSPVTTHAFIQTIPLSRCEGGGDAQLPDTHQETQLSPSCTIRALWWLCWASLAISILSPWWSGRAATPGWTMGKVALLTGTITLLSASLCCCNSSSAKYPPKSDLSPWGRAGQMGTQGKCN